MDILFLYEDEFETHSLGVLKSKYLVYDIACMRGPVNMIVPLNSIYRLSIVEQGTALRLFCQGGSVVDISAAVLNDRRWTLSGTVAEFLTKLENYRVFKEHVSI